MIKNIFLTLMMASLLTGATQALQPRCVKWTWSGDVYNRKTVCLVWEENAKKTQPEKKNNKTGIQQ